MNAIWQARVILKLRAQTQSARSLVTVTQDMLEMVKIVSVRSIVVLERNVSV